MLETPFRRSVHFTIKEELEYPENFFLWIANNWHLFKEFVDRAHEAMATGKQITAKGIFEDIRTDSRLRQKGEPTFKINNNYTPGCARLAMRIFPELRGYFRLRDRNCNDVKQEAAA